MHTPFHKLPTFDPETGQLQVVTETPRGSRNKYSWVPEKGVFQLGKVLPEGHVFPYDFGFLPQTQGEDGDPLDVLLLTEASIPFPGCLVPARLVGVIEAEQQERDGKTERNDRLLAVAEPSRAYRDLNDLEELRVEMLEEIEQFFVSYNGQSGKRFVPLGHGDAARARQLVDQARGVFKQKN